MEIATEKQRSMVAHLLPWMKREKLGIPKVMRGRVDYSGSVLDAVIARSDRWMVSELIEKLLLADAFPTENNEGAALSILNQLGYFDALDRANAEAARDAHASATAMQSAT